MSTTTTHTPDREALEALVWGVLDASESAELSAHADRCPECAMARAELVAERAVLGDVLGPIIAPPVVAPAAEAAPAVPAELPVAQPGAASRFTMLASGFLGGAACAVAAVMLAGALGQPSVEPVGVPAPSPSVRIADAAPAPAPETAPTAAAPLAPEAEPEPVAASEPVSSGPAHSMPDRPDGAPSPARPIVAEALADDEAPAIDFSVIGRVSARDARRNEVGDLALSRVSIEAFIGTGLATTAIEHTFSSASDQILEGLYEVTIPKGASVERYELSSENGWLEGRFVEREYARRVYESYLPQQRDPGLVEWQDGQRFTARVFPIPAKGDKGVLLGYTEPVAAKNGRVRWVLPLADVLEKIGLHRFEATVRIPAPAAGVAGVHLRRHPGTATVSRHGDEVVIHITGRLPVADAIIVDVESPNGAARLHTAPPRANEDAGYGLVALSPRAFLQADAQPARGADIVFIVDRSGSMQGQQLTDATTQLRDALEKLGPDDRFAVIAFSDLADQVTAGFLPADPQTAAELASNLHARGANGGTHYATAFAGAAGLIAGRDDAKRPAIVVVLTDGENFKDISTSAGAPVFAVPIGTTDRHQLDLSARAHGGSAMGSAVEAIAAAPHRALARIRAELGGATLVHPSSAAVFDPDEEIVFAFRLDPAGAAPRSIELEVEHDGVTRGIVIDLPRAEPITPVRAARAWARARIVDLLREPARHKDELARLGVGYRFVTPFTSILVLESEQEYERWGLGEDQITEEGKAGQSKEGKTLLAQAEQALQDGRMEEAVRMLDEAIALDPSTQEALVVRGVLRNRQGDLQGALADFDRAIALDPTASRAWVNRGTARLRMGDTVAAMRDFDRVIELDPRDPSAWRARARIREHLGDEAGARADLARAEELLGLQNDAFTRDEALAESTVDPSRERAITRNRMSAIPTFESVLPQSQETHRTIADLRGEKERLRRQKDAEITKLRSDLTREQAAAVPDEAEKKRLTDEIARLQRERATARLDAEKATTEIDAQIEKLKASGGSQADLDESVKALETAHAQIARLQHIQASLERDLADSRTQYGKTSKDLRDKDLLITMLRDKGVDIESLVYGPPPPPIAGVVVSVRPIEDDPAHPLVLLGVGSNDKVEKGFQFSIHRGNDFIAKVVVEKVMPDMAGCRVLFFKDGQTIQEGDRASTRLPGSVDIESGDRGSTDATPDDDRGARVIIEGKVQEIRPVADLPGYPVVKIDIGANVDVKVGYRFTIERDGVPVATLDVVSVQPDSATCRVVDLGEGAPIRLDDKVSARLP